MLALLSLPTRVATMFKKHPASGVWLLQWFGTCGFLATMVTSRDFGLTMLFERTPDEADPPADPTTRAADEDDFWGQPRRPKVKVTRGPAEPSYYGDLDGHFLAVFAKAFDKKLLSVVVPEEVRPTQDDSIGLGYDSYADIFLAHARLFVFADCYDINRLAGKALNAFHRALARSGGKVTDVVPLVEYCIETDIPDALRDVVLTYLTSKAKVLWSEPSFRELLERSHNMSFDLLDTIFRELGTSKT